MIRTIFLLVASAWAMPAMAYIGPGAGISVLGSVLAFIVSVLVAIAAIVLWPVRKALRKRKAKAAADSGVTDDVAGDG